MLSSFARATANNVGFYKTRVPHFGQWVAPVPSCFPFSLPHVRQNTDEQDGQMNFLFAIFWSSSIQSDPVNVVIPPLRS
jgi:hypothetical protein